MRKITLALVILVFCLSPLFAEQSPLELMTSSAVPTPYDGGMFTGFIIDVVGYGLFIAGGAVTSLDLMTGLILFDVGALSMTIGGTVWTYNMSAKHDAWAATGLPMPNDLKNLSWTLTWASVGCMAGSIVCSFIPDFFVSAILNVVLAGAAGIIETCNAWLVRIEWNPKMNEAYKAKRAEGPEMMPVFTAAYDPAVRGITGFAGVSIQL